MRVVFLGNGPFAAVLLARLAKTPVEIALVIARPDLPSGKHQEIIAGPVAKLAGELGLPMLQPASVNTREFADHLQNLDADLLVVADFGQILKSFVLSSARQGGINVHGSLLPKYRGAAPVAWAILQGEKTTGVTLIQMSPAMDAGGILSAASLDILPDETAFQLEARLAHLGAELLVTTLEQLTSSSPPVPVPQDQSLITAAPKLQKDMGRLDWTKSAQALHNQVRALQPWPGAFVEWQRAGGEILRLQILTTRVSASESTSSEPGTITQLAKDLLGIQTGAGILDILELKPAGKKAMKPGDFANGYRLAVGSQLHLKTTPERPSP